MSVAMEKEFIIFSDESIAQGAFFSNFYGGLLIGASDLQSVSNALNSKKRELNLLGEVKWKKVTEQYLTKYEELMRLFFGFVIAGRVKIRIMFTQNARRATRLSPEDIEHGYFKLYYQFIKHAFGLMHREPRDQTAHLRLYFDQFPGTREKAAQFKGFLLALNENPQLTAARIAIRREDITEVRSHDHVLLQCLDVVLGAMAFRLNELHKAKPPGSSRRGKRTIAKEKLYKVILSQIRTIRPNFNIGMTTGRDGDWSNYWRYPYMHWCFKSRDSIFVEELTKRGRIK